MGGTEERSWVKVPQSQNLEDTEIKDKTVTGRQLETSRDRQTETDTDR